MKIELLAFKGYIKVDSKPVLATYDDQTGRFTIERLTNYEAISLVDVLTRLPDGMVTGTRDGLGAAPEAPVAPTSAPKAEEAPTPAQAPEPAAATPAEPPADPPAPLAPPATRVDKPPKPRPAGTRKATPSPAPSKPGNSAPAAKSTPAAESGGNGKSEPLSAPPDEGEDEPDGDEQAAEEHTGTDRFAPTDGPEALVDELAKLTKIRDVIATLEDNGFKGVDALVAKCTELKAAGTVPVLKRCSDIGNRVRTMVQCRAK